MWSGLKRPGVFCPGSLKTKTCKSGSAEIAQQLPFVLPKLPLSSKILSLTESLPHIFLSKSFLSSSRLPCSRNPKSLGSVAE